MQLLLSHMFLSFMVRTSPLRERRRSSKSVIDFHRLTKSCKLQGNDGPSKVMELRYLNEKELQDPDDEPADQVQIGMRLPLLTVSNSASPSLDPASEDFCFSVTISQFNFFFYCWSLCLISLQCCYVFWLVPDEERKLKTLLLPSVFSCVAEGKDLFAGLPCWSSGWTIVPQSIIIETRSIILVSTDSKSFQPW